ncbi:unnamed protein product [Boreogadus saida]
MSPRMGTGFDGRGGGRRSVEKAHPVEGWWVLNSRILFIPSEQQADKPSAGSDASLSQAVLQSIGRGQLGLEDGSPQIRNQPGKTKMDPFRTAIVLSSSCGGRETVATASRCMEGDVDRCSMVLRGRHQVVF